MSVIHIKNAPKGFGSDPDYVYIGRRGKGCDGYFGNPFPLQAGESRGSSIARFETWARSRAQTDATYREAVKGLHGKTLVCFCKPFPCHGDVLEALATELGSEKESGSPASQTVPASDEGQPSTSKEPECPGS
jgi:hypothetical protein